MAVPPTPPNRDFANSVFVNCPFDEQYDPLFRALVFTVAYCGFWVRCALDADDSGETRAEKLIRTIRECRLGIHDISRTEPNANGLPRFNMPYEFGVFVGFRYGGSKLQRQKRALVLDVQKYRYQEFLSDIAGQDIRSHGGAVQHLVREVRNWLQNQTERNLVGAERVLRRFAEFTNDLPDILAEAGKSEVDLTNFTDYHRHAIAWIEDTEGRGS